MYTTRRKFITTTLTGGLAVSLPVSTFGSEPVPDKGQTYAQLDEILKKPVLKKELFNAPVIIESLDLLRYKDSFLCRVRSKDGAEGWSFANDGPMKTFYPVFTNRLQPFFIGKDARDWEALQEEVYVYQSNYKFQSLALWVPLATIEFAILDMLGRIAGKSMGELIGEIHHPTVNFYQANSERDIAGEDVLKHLQEEVAASKTKALKFKVGGRMSHPEFPVGRSDKLIPLMRKTFGDEMHLFADSNGSYDAAEAIRIGKLLQEYKYDFFEEPVPFDWYEETKEVADTLAIPISGGEQEASMHNFRWLIANDALQIVQPDVYYFGGMIRSMRVARMAAALGKKCTPHISEGFGYLYMMHFVSALPNAGEFHEFKGDNKKIPVACKTSSLKIADGSMKVPTGSGSGVDVDPDYLKRYQIVSK
jgi:L-alanine-DL-glutamate epimerase-like enolase superfamily enzyme